MNRTRAAGARKTLLACGTLMCAAGIAALGYFYYAAFEKKYRLEIDQQLEAISALKAGELFQYRKERLDDASILAENSAIASLVRRFLDAPEDQGTANQLEAWLGKFTDRGQYERVFLLDDRSSVRASFPKGGSRAVGFLALPPEGGLHSGKPSFKDFYRDEGDGRVYLALLVPVLDPARFDRLIGTIVLRIDPDTYLFPFIQEWPTPRSTAETLLVRREGGDALFLNELKFQKDTTMKLRISLERKEVPAVMAALGRKGIVEGIDYRGVPVIASLRPVPDSPWLLVARMDISEAYAPARERLRMLIVTIGALIFGGAASLLLLWRSHSHRLALAKAGEMRELNGSLERHVAERTASLEGAVQELEDFSYSVAHDLRSPLRAIDGFSRFLEEDYAKGLDSEAVRLIRVIRSNAQRMDRLITDLLHLASVNRVELRSSRTDMSELAASAFEEVSAESGLPPFELRAEPVAEAWGDEGQLRKVWLNLFSNAVKFSSKSESRLIWIGGRSEGTEEVYFVKDAGAGFDPEYGDKLFGVFQRLHTMEEFEGNGIGLAIVKRIVLRHSGRVWACSEGPGRGAVFFFSLPKKEESA